MATSTPVRHAWRALTGLLVITALLVGIGRGFVVEHPEELRVLVRELGGRLLEAADQPTA